MTSTKNAYSIIGTRDTKPKGRKETVQYKNMFTGVYVHYRNGIKLAIVMYTKFCLLELCLDEVKQSWSFR